MTHGDPPRLAWVFRSHLEFPPLVCGTTRGHSVWECYPLGEMAQDRPRSCQAPRWTCPATPTPPGVLHKDMLPAGCHCRKNPRRGEAAP